MKMQALPQYINPIKAAANQENLSANIALSHFSRLKNHILNPKEKMHVEIKFYKSIEKFVVIETKIDGILSVTCQRCTKPMGLAINIQSAVTPVSDDAAAKSLPSHLEAVILNEDKINLYELIEEEILLSFPLVTMHAELNQCS